MAAFGTLGVWMVHDGVWTGWLPLALAVVWTVDYVCDLRSSVVVRPRVIEEHTGLRTLEYARSEIVAIDVRFHFGGLLPLASVLRCGPALVMSDRRLIDISAFDESWRRVSRPACDLAAVLNVPVVRPSLVEAFRGKVWTLPR